MDKLSLFTCHWSQRSEILLHLENVSRAILALYVHIFALPKVSMLLMYKVKIAKKQVNQRVEGVSRRL